MNKYVFKPYEEIFPDLFDKEKLRLQHFLTGNYRIEHIGSTAIPDLGGKGIIDIYIATAETNLQTVKDQLVKARYEYRPQASTLEHLFFRVDLPDPIEKTRRYHIHLANFDSEDYKKTVAFRDYLRSHPIETKQYAEIKIKATKVANEDKDEYMKIKSPFMQEILHKTLKKL